jgi:hypothetical protein
VVNWARKQGLAADGSRRDVVVVEGTVAAIERALKTRLAYWQHSHSNTVHLRTLEYTIPDEVHEHIEIVAGCVLEARRVYHLTHCRVVV